MAGESADDVARRAREKAERLLKHAEMYEKGAEGERVVGELLATLPPEWFVLNDIRWPGRARANIDHVVIGPGGVFVIDSKNWSGAITIKSGVLRQNGYNRTKAIEGAIEAVGAIRELMPSLDPQAFVSVLCFVGGGEVRGVVSDVHVCDAASLIGLLTSRPRVLGADWLAFLRFELDMSTRNASGPTTAAGPPRRPTGQEAPAEPVLSEPAPAKTRVPGKQPAIGWRGTQGLLRRLLGGIVLWWFGCIVVYFGLGPVTGHSHAFLTAAYVGLAMLSIFLVTFVVS